MPVIAYSAAASNLAPWLWRNRFELGDAFAAIADRVESALVSPRPEIQRIGSAVVSLRDDQTRVLCLLHQHDARLDGIAEAVDGLTAGQAALGHSLDALRQLTMISLGVSAVAHLVLLHQFRLLGRQLHSLGEEIRRVRELARAQELGRLEAGLTQLQHGIEDIEAGTAGRTEQGRATLNTIARDNLANSVNTHAILLERELTEARPTRSVVRELFRHMAVGLMGEAGCHLRLGNGGRAREVIDRRVGLAEGYQPVE